LALKWINENAAKFGGDPNRITLLGYDSGALYATYHMVYKPSWPLFRNVIVQSLSPINLARSHLSPRTASNRAAAFVQHLNCSSLKCLYEMNAFNLTVQSRSFLHGFMSQKSILSTSFLKSAFQPVVDGRVFNESVIKSFREGRFKKCFMILGFNANSGASSIPLNYGLSQDPLNGNTQNIDYPQFEQFIRKCNLFEYYLRRFLSIACLPLFLTKTLHYLFIAGLLN
jgi:para-nitrobenzyl esterase